MFMQKQNAVNPIVMKKLKWMMLCLLALPLVSNIKASNCTVQKKMAVVKMQPASEPTTLIEQILFPHGI